MEIFAIIGVIAVAFFFILGLISVFQDRDCDCERENENDDRN